MSSHKNKTLATLLALLFGAIGAYRFYLHGKADRWGWLHFSTLPLSLLLLMTLPNAQPFFAMLPLTLSALSGVLAALVLGLTSDEKWDATHNQQSGRTSNSRWPLAILIVLSFGIGAVSAIWVIARTSDLLFTGGAYG